MAVLSISLKGSLAVRLKQLLLNSLFSSKAQKLFCSMTLKTSVSKDVDHGFFFFFFLGEKI